MTAIATATAISLSLPFSLCRSNKSYTRKVFFTFFYFFFCWVFARNYKDCFFVLIKLVYGDPFLNCSEKRS